MPTRTSAPPTPPAASPADRLTALLPSPGPVCLIGPDGALAPAAPGTRTYPMPATADLLDAYRNPTAA